MRIAICDDDKVFIKKMFETVKTICDNKNIRCQIESFQDGLELIENYDQYHLIFLDIEMPSINGIETAQKLNDLKGSSEIPFLVFVSSHDELVFEALKSFPYSFIRKSDITDNNCISEIIINVSKSINKKCITISIRTGREDVVLKVTDIIYLEKIKNYVVYHTGNQEYKVRSDINTEFKKIATYGFIRTHIGYVVNNRCVKYISNDNVLLENNINIPVSKKYREETKNNFFEWLGDMNA